MNKKLLKLIAGLMCCVLLMLITVCDVKAMVISRPIVVEQSNSSSREDCVVYVSYNAFIAGESSVEPQRIRNFEVDFTNIDAFRMEYSFWCDACYCQKPTFSRGTYYNIKFKDLYNKNVTEIFYGNDRGHSIWTPVIDLYGADYHNEIISCDIMLPSERCSVCGKDSIAMSASAGGFEFYDYRGVCTEFPSVSVEDGESVTLNPKFNAYTKRVEYKIKYEGDAVFTPLKNGTQANGMNVVIGADNSISITNVNRSKGSYFEILPVTYDKNNQLPYKFDENNNSHVARISIAQSSVQNPGQNPLQEEVNNDPPVVTPSVTEVPNNPVSEIDKTSVTGTTPNQTPHNIPNNSPNNNGHDKESPVNVVSNQKEQYTEDPKPVYVPMDIATASPDSNTKSGQTGSVSKNKADKNKPSKISDEKKKSLFDSIKDNSSEYVTTQEKIDKDNAIKKENNEKMDITAESIEKDEADLDIDESLLDESVESNYVPKLKYDSTFIAVMLSCIFAFLLLAILFALFFVVIIYAEKPVKNIITGEDEKKKVPVAIRLVMINKKMWSLNMNDLLNEYGTLYAHLGLIFVYLYEDEFMRILSKVKGDEKREIAKEQIKREVIIGKGKARLR